MPEGSISASHMYKSITSFIMSGECEHVTYSKAIKVTVIVVISIYTYNDTEIGHTHILNLALASVFTLLSS